MKDTDNSVVIAEGGVEVEEGGGGRPGSKGLGTAYFSLRAFSATV